MTQLANRARVVTATTGTGTITLGSALPRFQTFAAAGVQSGATVPYLIEDGADWELGSGVYNGTTLTRTVSESSNADAPINLSGSAIVSITARAEELSSRASLDEAVALSIIFGS
jgi:hypothetical protein